LTDVVKLNLATICYLLRCSTAVSVYTAWLGANNNGSC